MDARITPRRLPALALLGLLAMGATGCASLTAADKQFEAGHYHLALEEYRAVYDDHSRDPGVNYRVAFSLYQLARYPKAEKYFRRSAELQQPTVEHLRYWADCRVRQKLYADAATLYSRILDRDAKDPSAWNNLGLMKLHLGDTAEARRAFETALSHNPQHAPALLNLGLLYERNERDPAKAEDYYRRYREVAPDGEQAQAVREWLVDRDKLTAAVHAARKRSAQPTPPPAPISTPAPADPPPAPVSAPVSAAPAPSPATSDDALLATPAAPDKPPPVSEPPEQPAAAPDAPAPDAPVVIAGSDDSGDGPPSGAALEAMAERGDHRAILAAFAAGVDEKHPDYGEHCYYLGLAYLEQKDGAHARQFLEAAAKARPDDPRVKLQLGWALAFLGQSDEARSWWRRSLTEHPEQAESFRQALRTIE